MIHIMNCPKCHETVSFLNGEDTKMCKKCGEIVYNTKVTKPEPKKIKKSK